MSEEEKKLWEELLAEIRFCSTPHFLDDKYKIIRNAVLYTIESKGLRIDPKEGSNEGILKRYSEFSKNYSKPFKLALKDKDGNDLELIHYFPQNVMGDGQLFLVDSKNQTVTEFTNYEGIDPSVTPIKGRHEEEYYYTRNFGAKITTIKFAEDGMFLNELKINHKAKDLEYPIATVTESESSAKFYDGIDSEEFDFANLMIEVPHKTPGVSGTKEKISIIKKISKALKRQRLEPDFKRSKTFKYLNGVYEMPTLDSRGTENRDFSYIKSAIESNKEVFEKFIEDPSIEETEEKPVDEDVVSVLKGEQSTVKEAAQKPVLLDLEVENKLFKVLFNQMKKTYSKSCFDQKDEKILSRIVFEILKAEDLHFNVTEGGSVIQSLENCRITSDGFTLVNKEGEIYKIYAGDSSKVVTIIGPGKIINIRHGYRQWLADRPEIYKITTIVAKAEGVFKNENTIAFSREYDRARLGDRFYIIDPETEYYHKDIFSVIGINLGDFMKNVMDNIRYHSDSDCFEDIHKFGTDFADLDKSSIKYDIEEFVRGREGCPEDEDKFNELFIGQNIALNYQAIETFLSQKQGQKL